MSELKIYKFGSITDGDATMKNELGGKGANLAEMSNLGIPVPPGFTIPCAASVEYEMSSINPHEYDLGFNNRIRELVMEGMKYLKAGQHRPLVSVRSGARVSMPGMMDTILNVGMTSKTLPHWIGKIGQKAALDCYRRLIQMYSSVALGIDMKLFDQELDAMKAEADVKVDSELNADQLSRLVKRYLAVVDQHGKVFPDTPLEQVIGAVYAVFESWNNPRAIEYRKINNIPNDWGTAVTVQAMVFGNMNDNSATGVLFSRNPSNGDNLITGEYLVNAQGEDVVAGIRTPEPLTTLHEWDLSVALELTGIVSKLEAHYRDMQDIEFTVQDGKLYLLQTRNGKRSALAAFKIAHDLCVEGVISKEIAAQRVTSDQLFSVMQDSIDPKFKTQPSFTGIAAGGGVVKGVAMFSSESAINCTEPCILVRKETDPDDIGGMNASVGILTATGGLTSHAAVVARGMNKSCVVGCTDMLVGPKHAAVKNGGPVFHEGDKLTIDGATGNVWVGVDVPLIAGGASELVKTVVSWAQSVLISNRLELHAGMSQEEIVKAVTPTADSESFLYIDTISLEGKDRLGGPDLQDSMMQLGHALSLNPGQQVIVDLSGREEHYSLGDKAFDIMFGLSSAETGKVSLLKFNVMSVWPDEVKGRCTVKIGEGQSYLRVVLKSSGFSVAGSITTFADLLNADGPVSASDSVIKNVFGSHEAFEFAKNAVVSKNGKPAAALPPPSYWYEPLTNKV